VEPLLEIKDLRVTFPIYGGVLRHKVAEVRAVDGVSFSLGRGETLGLVGESGSGKTTIGRAILNLLRTLSPEVALSGKVIYHDNGESIDLNGLSRHAMAPYRTQIQMIFQDPFASLNPRMTVGEIIGRSLKLHTSLSRRERLNRTVSVLDRVGLQADAIRRYPHEFSGGQRQRIGIARAVVTRPRLIVADEPVSALDVSVQAQVINLLQELQEEFGLTYLFIAHDLSVVYHVSDRIAVMYLGDIVEIGSAERVYREPRHPYTRALLSAVPQPDPSNSRAGRTVLVGDIPTPLGKPSGCAFHSRCPIAQNDCSSSVPSLDPIENDRAVACPYAQRYEELADNGSVLS